MKNEDLKCCGNCGFGISETKKNHTVFLCMNVYYKKNDSVGSWEVCEKWQWDGTEKEDRLRGY